MQVEVADEGPINSGKDVSETVQRSRKCRTLLLRDKDKSQTKQESNMFTTDDIANYRKYSNKPPGGLLFHPLENGENFEFFDI